MLYSMHIYIYILRLYFYLFVYLYTDSIYDIKSIILTYLGHFPEASSDISSFRSSNIQCSGNISEI